MAQTVCPAGIPQDVCNELSSRLQTAQNAGQVPASYDANDILRTFQQWYPDTALSRGGNPAIPSDLPSYGSGTLAKDVLDASAEFWRIIGSSNPGVARTVDISTFPWQYLRTENADPTQNILNTLNTIMSDPNAKQWLSLGKLPPFDPGGIDTTGIWNDPGVWPAAVTGMGTFVPALQAFVQKGATCGLFTKSTTVVNQAWINFITFGGNPNDPRADPCVIASVTPGIPTPPTPPPVVIVNPPIQTTPETPASTSTTELWVPIALTAIGVGALGLIVYNAMRSKQPLRASTLSEVLVGPEKQDAKQVMYRGVPIRLEAYKMSSGNILWFWAIPGMSNYVDPGISSYTRTVDAAKAFIDRKNDL